MREKLDLGGLPLANKSPEVGRGYRNAMHPLPTGSRPSYLLVRRAEFPGPRTRSILANVNSQSIRTNTYFFGTKYVGAERAQVSQTMWRPASAGHAESRDEAWLGFSREAGDSNRLCAGICEDPRKTLGSQKTAASEVHEPDGGEKTVGRLSEPGADQNQPPRRWTAAKRLEAASAALPEGLLGQPFRAG